jgi:hypothetical protein
MEALRSLFVGDGDEGLMLISVGESGSRSSSSESSPSDARADWSMAKAPCGLGVVGSDSSPGNISPGIIGGTSPVAPRVAPIVAFIVLPVVPPNVFIIPSVSTLLPSDPPVAFNARSSTAETTAAEIASSHSRIAAPVLPSVLLRVSPKDLTPCKDLTQGTKELADPDASPRPHELATTMSLFW